MRKWLLAVAILLSGCAPTKQFVVQSPDTLAEAGSNYKDKATLYVFRENTFASGGWSLEVSVDGVKRTTLRTKTYALFPVESGKHNVKFHWLALGAGNPDIALTVEFSPDKTYYFTFSTDAHVVVNTLPGSSEPSQFQTMVQQITSKGAQERMTTFAKRDAN
jgi:hypothetical protein